MLCSQKPFIMTETIGGTACRDCSLCDGVCGPRLMLGRVFIVLFGYVYPHYKYSFVVWSYFSGFNEWGKSRSGDSSVPLSSLTICC